MLGSAARTPEIAAPSIFQRMERCRLLGHPTAYWCRRYVANGTAHVCFWCDECDRPVTRERYEAPGASVTGDWLRRKVGLDPERLPPVSKEIRYRLCARCGVTAPCEMHHIAPRALFGDADSWPVVPLCGSCHLEFSNRLEAHIRRSGAIVTRQLSPRSRQG